MTNPKSKSKIVHSWRFWQREQHFEWIIPLALDDCIRAFNTKHADPMDTLLHHLDVVHEQENPDQCRFALFVDKVSLVQGYFKALPDGTTLVSGRAMTGLRLPLRDDFGTNSYLVTLWFWSVFIIVMVVWAWSNRQNEPELFNWLHLVGGFMIGELPLVIYLLLRQWQYRTSGTQLANHIVESLWHRLAAGSENPVEIIK